MKAYILKGINNIRYEETKAPICPDGWAIVKVKAAGICSSDIQRIFTKGTYHFPTIPGHEFSGVVENVSNAEDNSLIGKRVGIFPLIPCRECLQCKEGDYEICSDYDYVGSRRDGGFAEYVAVPVWNLVELPEDISFVEAAMMEPLAVALHAIRKADVDPGDNVAVVGTGMIGFAAALWAQKFGALNVTVIGRGDDKRKLAKKIEGLNYMKTGEVVREFDIVVEAAGNNTAIGQAINIVKPGGALILIGNPSGDIHLQKNTYWRILRKQININGIWNSHYENYSTSDWSIVRDALEKHEIITESLVSHIFNQNQLLDGLKLMHEHTEPYCKVMTLWNEDQ